MSISAITTHLNALRTEMMKYPAFQKFAEDLEKKTNVPTENFVVGILVILSGCLFLNIFASFISNMVGFVYPMYATIKAIETPSKADDCDWLMYWVVFGMFCVIENFAEVFLYFIPFFYPLKVTFLLWCMLDQFKGAKVVYDNVIQPIIKRHSAVDAALDEVDPKAAAAAEN
jgi:receptor expression-enhancing protein 5/6